MRHDNIRFAPVCAALAAAVALAACGGGGSGSGNDSGAAAQDPIQNAPPPSGGNHGAGGGQGTLSGHGITAFLNGQEKAATVDVQGSLILGGSASNSMTGKGTGTPPLVWSIQHLKAAVGEYTCKSVVDPLAIAYTDASIMLGGGVPDPTQSWKIQSTTAPDGGDCRVNVTSLDNNVIKGTFTATLVAQGTQPGQKEVLVFDNGAFSVPFQALSAK